MSAEHTKWDKLKNNYLKQVEQALASTNHPKSSDVLRDVDEHLDRKCAELKPDKQSWEGYQQILIEMGPPDDYAELLAEAARPADTGPWKWLNTLLAIIFVFTMIVVGGYLIYNAETNPPDDNTAKPSTVLPQPIPPFELTERLPGTWQTVDFVRSINDFEPGRQQWGHDFHLKQLIFYKNGTTSGPWEWNEQFLRHTGNLNVSHYTVRQIQGQLYLFMEWNSGDVTIRGQDPCYYVLKKIEPSPVAYIIIFKSSASSQVRTARQLLALFNESHPPGIQTHHYRTKIEDGILVGGICTDSRSDAEAVRQMLDRHESLEFIGMKPFTSEGFEQYQQHKQVSLSSPSEQTESTPVVLSELPEKDIVLHQPDCTAAYVQSVLGTPNRIDYDGRLLRYHDAGFGFWFSQNGPLSEIRLNEDCRARLKSGISLQSSRQDVFTVYGEPIRIVDADDLHHKNDESILYRKGNISRIYYGCHGLIFWFKDDTINQIVIFKGSLVHE